MNKRSFGRAITMVGTGTRMYVDLLWYMALILTALWLLISVWLVAIGESRALLMMVTYFSGVKAVLDVSGLSGGSISEEVLVLRRVSAPFLSTDSTITGVSLLAFAIGIVRLMVLLLVLRLFRRFSHGLVSGRGPFFQNAGGVLRVSGVLLLLGFGLTLLLSWVYGLRFSNPLDVADGVQVIGVTIPGASVMFWCSMVCFVLSQAFEAGLSLREEQSLTI